eukprot:12430623-Karenia_brevis.AAC.1
MVASSGECEDDARCSPSWGLGEDNSKAAGSNQRIRQSQNLRKCDAAAKTAESNQRMGRLHENLCKSDAAAKKETLKS